MPQAPPVAAPSLEPPPSPFPDEHALCERCGYPLRELFDDASCPECGLPVAESDPVHRDGPPWQRRPSLANWLRTVAAPFRRPHATFRRMTLAGSNARPRAFLLTIALLVGTGWGLLDLLALPVPPTRAASEGVAAAALCLVLTALEAAGVWFFAGRRGWRVPLWLAERLACYAAAGWLLSLPLAWGLRAVAGWTLQTGAWLTITHPFAGWSLFIAWAIVFAAVILPFELLVYFGVRQLRFANAPPGDPGSPSPPVSPGQAEVAPERLT